MDEDEPKMLTYDSDCPRHYRGDGYITASRAMVSASIWHRGRFVNSVSAVSVTWWWCCAFKYVWRCLSKGQTLSDIDKAIDCLQKLRKEVEPIEAVWPSMCGSDSIITK